MINIHCVFIYIYMFIFIFIFICIYIYIYIFVCLHKYQRFQWENRFLPRNKLPTVDALREMLLPGFELRTCSFSRTGLLHRKSSRRTVMLQYCELHGSSWYWPWWIRHLEWYTNSSPLEMVVSLRNLLLQGSVFRGYVSFREGIV